MPIKEKKVTVEEQMFSKDLKHRLFSLQGEEEGREGLSCLLIYRVPEGLPIKEKKLMWKNKMFVDI